MCVVVVSRLFLAAKPYLEFFSIPDMELAFSIEAYMELEFSFEAYMELEFLASKP